MQQKNGKISFGQIRLPIAENIAHLTVFVPGAQVFASLFSDALSLRVGDGSDVAITKGTKWGEGGSYNYFQ